MCKKNSQLTIRVKYMIEDLIQEGKTQNYIAEKLDRDKSTISRELARNRDADGIYHTDYADHLSLVRCKRESFRHFTESVKLIIEDKLIIHWAGFYAFC